MPGDAPAQQGVGLTPPPEGTTAPGNPDPLCEDCDEPLSAHTSPILRDGEVVGLANPENSCRRFIPRD